MKYLILLVCVCGFVGLNAQISDLDRRATAHMEPFYIEVTTENAKAIQALQGPNLVLIDVRTPEEVAQGKIKGALEMDIKSNDFKEKVAALDKTKQYMVYCYAGGLSANAMKIMKEMGFKQIYTLQDGYRAWAQTMATK